MRTRDDDACGRARPDGASARERSCSVDGILELERPQLDDTADHERRICGGQAHDGVRSLATTECAEQWRAGPVEWPARARLLDLLAKTGRRSLGRLRRREGARQAGTHRCR